MFDIEFNPKGPTLLDEQLAESGLEMHWVQVALGLGSAALGFFGQQSSNNSAKKAQKKAEKLAEEAAEKTNEYNAEVFEVDKRNYYANRAYEWESAVRSWQQNQLIQDWGYLQTVRQFAKSVDNFGENLTYNELAAQESYSAEEAALAEIYQEDAFTRQGDLVDRLVAEGGVQIGQAGVSQKKGMQSALAAYGRNTAILDASLTSSVEQARRNFQQINIQRRGADIQAKQQLMIRPERAPELLQPIQAPEREFIAPMEVLPQAIAPAQQQSTFTPLVSGLVSAASAIPWGSLFPSGGVGGGSPFGGFGNYSNMNLNSNFWT